MSKLISCGAYTGGSGESYWDAMLESREGRDTLLKILNVHIQQHDLDEESGFSDVIARAYLYRGRIHKLNESYIDALNDFSDAVTNDSSLEDLVKTLTSETHRERNEKILRKHQDRFKMGNSIESSERLCDWCHQWVYANWTACKKCNRATMFNLFPRDRALHFVEFLETCTKYFDESPWKFFAEIVGEELIVHFRIRHPKERDYREYEFRSHVEQIKGLYFVYREQFNLPKPMFPFVKWWPTIKLEFKMERYHIIGDIGSFSDVFVALYNGKCEIWNRPNAEHDDPVHDWYDSTFSPDNVPFTSLTSNNENNFKWATYSDEFRINFNPTRGRS